MLNVSDRLTCPDGGYGSRVVGLIDVDTDRENRMVELDIDKIS